MKKFEDFVVAKTECFVLVLVFVFVSFPESKALYCLEFPQALSCLYQAMQTRKTFFIAKWLLYNLRGVSRPFSTWVFNRRYLIAFIRLKLMRLAIYQSVQFFFGKKSRIFETFSLFLIANAQITFQKLKVKANLALSSISWTAALKTSVSAFCHIQLDWKVKLQLPKRKKSFFQKKKNILKYEIALVSFETTSCSNLRAKKEIAFDF